MEVEGNISNDDGIEKIIPPKKADAVSPESLFHTCPKCDACAYDIRGKNAIASHIKNCDEEEPTRDV